MPFTRIGQVCSLCEYLKVYVSSRRCASMTTCAIPLRHIEGANLFQDQGKLILSILIMPFSVLLKVYCSSISIDCCAASCSKVRKCILFQLECSLIVQATGLVSVPMIYAVTKIINSRTRFRISLLHRIVAAQLCSVASSVFTVTTTSEC